MGLDEDTTRGNRGLQTCGKLHARGLIADLSSNRVDAALVQGRRQSSPSGLVDGPEVLILGRQGLVEKLQCCQWTEIGERSPRCEGPNHLLGWRDFKRLQCPGSLLRRCAPLVYPIGDDGVAAGKPPCLLQVVEFVIGKVGWSGCPHRISAAGELAPAKIIGDENVAVL